MSRASEDRRRPSLVLLALALAAVAAASAQFVVAESARVWMANGGWLLSSTAALIGVRAAMRAGAARDRGGWALLLCGCAAWLVGELCWITYELTSYPTSPNAADLCWLAFALLGGVGVLRLGAVARGRSVSWLELTPLVAAVCAVLAAALWNDIRASTLASGAVTAALAYPVLYASAALVMLQSVVTGTLDIRANPGLGLVLAGLVVEAVAFVLWTPLLLSAGYVAGTHALDALWTVGMVLVGLGAATARQPKAVSDVERVSHRRGAVLPSTTFAVLALVQTTVILSDASVGAELALSAGMVITGATLSVRAARLRREQDALYEQLRDRERELSDANRRLSRESRLDPLTGVANRLRLDEDLVELAALHQRHGRAYCLVLCDLDRFKDYNDALGHQAGDVALRHVAALLDGETRAGDRVYRYGGEEFLLVLPDQDAHAGATLAERHRAGLERAGLPHPRNPPTEVMTFSAGVAAAQPGESAAQVLHRADRALYRAKSSGRNRIAVAAAEALPRPAARAAL
jgi:diguanylate cyclase (GGDEF)-like protein